MHDRYVICEWPLHPKMASGIFGDRRREREVNEIRKSCNTLWALSFVFFCCTLSRLRCDNLLLEYGKSLLPTGENLCKSRARSSIVTVFWGDLGRYHFVGNISQKVVEFS